MKAFLLPMLVVCCACGCACRHDAAMQLSTQAAYAHAFLSAGDPFEILRDLRAGDTTNAIETLENRLDGGIIELSAALPEQRDQKKRAAYVRLLKKVRDYRAAHPWKSASPEVQGAVAKALAEIPDESVAK
jgi:hypothetical protein